MAGTAISDELRDKLRANYPLMGENDGDLALLLQQGLLTEAQLDAAVADMLVAATATVGAQVVMAEATNNGTSTITHQATAALAADRTITYPDANVDLTDVNTMAGAAAQALDAAASPTFADVSTLAVTSAAALTQTAAETSAWGLAANDAADQTLTIAAFNAGAGDGILSLSADGEIEMSAGEDSTWSMPDNSATALSIGAAGATNMVVLDTTDNLEKTTFNSNIQRVFPSRDLSHQLRWEKMDDLFGKANTEAEHEWTLNSGSDGAALDPAIDTAQAGGVWQTVTGADAAGTVATDGSQMVWEDMPIRLDTLGAVGLVLEARVRLKTSIADQSFFFGLTDSTALEEPFTNAADVITIVATDAVGFLYDTDATTDEWWGLAADTGVGDAGNAATGTAPTADVWQTLRLEVSNDGATIAFFIDNAAAASLILAGDAGVGPDVVLYPTFVACSTTAGTTRTADIDWIRAEGVR